MGLKLRVLLIAFFFISCNNFKKNEESSLLVNNTVEISKFDLPDSIGEMLFPLDIYWNENNEILFTELETYSIYLLKNGHLKKFAETGKGPNEFNMPGYFHISDSIIYVQDESNNFINAYDFNFNFIKTIKIKKSPGITNFIIYNESVIIMNYFYDKHYLMINDKAYFKIPNIFKEQKIYPKQAGIVLLENEIYFMNAYENILFHFNLTDTLLNEIKIEGFNIGQFENIYDNNIEATEFENLKQKNVLIHSFHSLRYKNKDCFIIHYRKSEEVNSIKSYYKIPNRYVIFSKDGKKQAEFVDSASDGLANILISTHNEYLIFSNYLLAENNVYFTKVKLKGR